MEPKYSNGISHGNLCYAHEEKLKKTNNGRNRKAKSRKIQNRWRIRNNLHGYPAQE